MRPSSEFSLSNMCLYPTEPIYLKTESLSSVLPVVQARKLKAQRVGKFHNTEIPCPVFICVCHETTQYQLDMEHTLMAQQTVSSVSMLNSGV